MDAKERTRDVYEEIPGYPKPPLVPLPEPGDLETMSRLGVRPTKFSRQVIQTTMSVIGFNNFQRMLPDQLEGLLRRTNMRLPGLYSPVISATLALQDDPRRLTPIQRAASLIFAARNLHADIVSGSFPPDQLRGQPLEMGQYPNLFGTCLVVEGRGARMFKSTDVSHVIVAVARRFYRLDIGNLGSETTIEQLEEALAQLAHLGQQNRLRDDEPHIGLLTCASNGTQRSAFLKLSKIPANVTSLQAVRHSFLTVCLDLESSPSSIAEAAFWGHSTNCANRWWHSSLQLVVFGNARACVICNFTTYLDGNTMMRAAAELQRRAARSAVGAPLSPALPGLSPAVPLEWKVAPRLLRQAQRDLHLVQDNQQATFEILDIGRKFFAAQQVEAVPTFILALALTSQRLTGRVAKIDQFLTMSKYRCMDLVTANVTTPEVERFVDYMSSPQRNSKIAMALLREAIDSQARQARAARQVLPLPEILTLYFETLKGFRRRFVFVVQIIAAIVLRLTGQVKLEQREVVVSHPEIYPEIPVVGRPGVRIPYARYFGLHYQILDDQIVITMMPGVTWKVPNAELIAELERSLKQLQSIICDEQ